MDNIKIIEKEKIIKAPVQKMPWQISTAGLIVGFFLGLIPLLISLLANHQYKQGKDISELIKAYNIIIIFTAIVVGIALLIMIFAFFFMVIATLA